MFKRVLVGFQAAQRDNAPDTLCAAHDLAYNFYKQQQQYKDAEPFFERALKRQPDTVGRKPHPETLMAAQNLALVYDLNV